MYRVFVDGKEGTTGLRIGSRLALRSDITVVTLPEALRKDTEARREALNNCDFAFLCLPDAAAVEAVSLIENPQVRVLDTSTAHRTDPDWAYGFPELSPAHREKIQNSKRVAVPGCHAGGFISLIYPLVANKLISPDSRLCCTSVTGYSGGGKKMIADYESESRSQLLSSPRQYALSQQHKHLKEMKAVSGLTLAPAFSPVVGAYYSGMTVTIPLFAEDLADGISAAEVKEVYQSLYKGPVVCWADAVDQGGFIAGNALSGKDYMDISVAGNEERLLLISCFDNLGKGASGAAVQCMNIMMGIDETTGLEVR